MPYSLWDELNTRTGRRYSGGRNSPDSDEWEPERKRRQREVFESWDDETRNDRATKFTTDWKVPEIDDSALSVTVDHYSQYDGYGATHTIGRWRKSYAKTEFAARLCLQLELDERT